MRTRDNVEDVIAAWLVVAVVAGRAGVEVYCAKWFHRAILKIRNSKVEAIFTGWEKRSCTKSCGFTKYILYASLYDL